MYLAELHGKLSRDNENKEDILTSNVFSFLKYANRKIFLLEFFRLLGLDVSADEAIKTEFHFWPIYEDQTEPDLVLIVGQYYLLFEAKYHSGFGQETQGRKHQIVREIEGGNYEAQNLGKIFKIIAVTAHYSDRSEIKSDIPKEYRDDLLWINWQSIALMVYQQIEKNPDLPIETRSFANDLYALLVRKKLRNFEGQKVFSMLSAGLRPDIERIFFEAQTASHRGAFLGFTNALTDFELVPPPQAALFWKYQRDFFKTLAIEAESIKPAETLFFSRRENE